MRSEPSGKAVSITENNGLLYGSLLGALVGVLIAGPHFSDWSIQKILAAIAVSSALIGMTGHFAICIVIAALSAGPNLHDYSDEQSSSTEGQQAIDD